MKTFEVKVEVQQKGSMHFSSHVGMYIENKIVKMFHKDAKTGKKAMQKCEKYGRPLSARKVDTDKMMGGGLLQIETYMANNPYPNAIAMDEMIWKKGKRAERIESRGKDKNGY